MSCVLAGLRPCKHSANFHPKVIAVPPPNQNRTSGHSSGSNVPEANVNPFPIAYSSNVRRVNWFPDSRPLHRLFDVADALYLARIRCTFQYRELDKDGGCLFGDAVERVKRQYKDVCRAIFWTMPEDVRCFVEQSLSCPVTSESIERDPEWAQSFVTTYAAEHGIPIVIEHLYFEAYAESVWCGWSEQARSVINECYEWIQTVLESRQLRSPDGWNESRYLSEWEGQYTHEMGDETRNRHQRDFKSWSENFERSWGITAQYQVHFDNLRDRLIRGFTEAGETVPLSIVGRLNRMSKQFSLFSVNDNSDPVIDSILTIPFDVPVPPQRSQHEELRWEDVREQWGLHHWHHTDVAALTRLLGIGLDAKSFDDLRGKRVNDLLAGWESWIRHNRKAMLSATPEGQVVLRRETDDFSRFLSPVWNFLELIDPNDAIQVPVRPRMVGISLEEALLAIDNVRVECGHWVIVPTQTETAGLMEAEPAASELTGREPPEQRRKSKRIPRDQAEIRVRDWLLDNKRIAKSDPYSITRKQVAEETGVSYGGVFNTSAWQAFDKKRKKDCPSQPREVPLTDEMTASIPLNGVRGKELAMLEALVKEQSQDMAQEEKSHKHRHRVTTVS